MTGKSLIHPHGGPMVEGAKCISCQSILDHHILRDNERILFSAYACPDDECSRFGLLTVGWAYPEGNYRYSAYSTQVRRQVPFQTGETVDYDDSLWRVLWADNKEVALQVLSGTMTVKLPCDDAGIRRVEHE
jgi:hypothetical protein